jgi:hypothetical protein
MTQFIIKNNNRLLEKNRLEERKKLEQQNRLAKRKKIYQLNRLVERQKLEEKNRLVERQKLEEKNRLAERQKLEEKNRLAQRKIQNNILNDQPKIICTLREWQKKSKDILNLIVQASDKSGNDSWKIFPIGMSYRYNDVYRKGKSIQVGKHNNLVFSAISTSTDQNRRSIITRNLILEKLKKNNILNIYLEPTIFFDNLVSHKFTISPEGNGIDCHRHYEALIAGCIPIIEDNPLTIEKYKSYPVLFTHDYSEITLKYLKIKYKEMINKKYDFSKLFLSFYDKETQKIIKDNGNHWMKRLCNVEWYR